MTPFNQAWALLKGTRKIEYDVGFDENILNSPKAMGVAGTMQRDDVIEPGPLPGFVYFHDTTTGTNKLMTEAEAEKEWPSHIDTKSYVSPTRYGMKDNAESASHRWRKPPYREDKSDYHFDEDETVRRFTENIAPTMAHEVGHVLDSQIGEGSFAQQEMPAHTLEQATREARNSRQGYPPLPIIPKARSLLLDRLNRHNPRAPYPTTIQTPEDNPNYQYDITDDTIISGEPMPFDQAWALLKSSSFTKPSEVRAGEAGGSLGGYQPWTGKAWTHPSNVYAHYKKLYPFGKLNEDALINETVGTDVHESMHEAMHNVGETYDSGLHEEYAPNLAEILVQSRMPGIHGGNRNQVMRLIHGDKVRGVEPRPDTQAAMDYTREYANSFGFNHPKVRKPAEGDGKLLTYGQTKPEFYTGYGEDLE